jgi:hypothetical protein
MNIVSRPDNAGDYRTLTNAVRMLAVDAVEQVILALPWASPRLLLCFGAAIYVITR